MNKDFDLKKHPSYGMAGLRGRIDEAIKSTRDDLEKLDQPQGKTMPVIPVTGSARRYKYFENKSREKF